MGNTVETVEIAGGMHRHDAVTWKAAWKVEKFLGEVTPEQINAGEVQPYEVIEREGNLLMYGGASALWHRLIGGDTVAAFSNANAHIGVGDSSTSAAAGQTDLQASTNKLRVDMEATYPIHTDATTDGAQSVVFRSVFGTSDANFAWNEWGIFNAASDGRMLNRKVESLGTKTSAATWTLTITLTLS